MKRAIWKYRICEKLYCKPQWNRRLMCLKCSFDEVYRILNTVGKCPGTKCSGIHLSDRTPHPCRRGCK